jgi:secondary thiamine-phosphate synthase enzyme
MLFKIELTTNSRCELIDITQLVKEKVKEAGIDDGICVVYTPHTTCGITINENADLDVKRDIVNFLNTKIPVNFPFNHMEGNSDAHLKSTIVGCCQTLIVENGKLLLGTWQGVLFAEFDGPRKRNFFIKFV